MTVVQRAFRRLAPEQVESLRAQVQGEVISQDDAQYEGACMPWNLSMQQQPEIVVMAESAEDIAAAVHFAREVGLGVAVQATGHGLRRRADGALLINTARMTGVEVDEVARTAWIEAGTKWGAVLERAQAFGLTPLLGSSPDVGAVGYTLGGGLGWLARKYGMAADSVRAFEVVTADGQIARASDSENSDLFWGLCGGGGSFAIVTGMEINLYPVATVYAGNLLYPIDTAPEVFRRYREWIATAPDELTTSIVVMNYPPLPVLPEFLRGMSFVQVRGCYCGPAEEGEALMRYWRDWQAPVIDDFKEIPFSQSAVISSDPLDPMPAFTTGAWLANLDDDTVETLLRYAAPNGQPSPVTMLEVRHAGGAVSAVDVQRNAYSHRNAELIMLVVAMAPSPEAYQGLVEYTDHMKHDLSSALTGGVYTNFVEGDEAVQRVRDAYSPETYVKLVTLKAAYDPENLFSFGCDFALEEV